MVARNPLHLVADPLFTFLAARFGSDIRFLRLPEVVFGAASVWLLWRLARPRLDRRRALLAAVFLAGSLFHIDWSIRLDFYALLVALTLAQSWALLAGAWRWYAGCAALFAYAHPYAWVVAAIHGVFLAVERRPMRSWARAWASAAALALPWAIFSTKLLVTGPAFAGGSGGTAVWRTALLFAATPSTAAGLGAPGVSGAALAALFAACWAVSLLRARRAARGGLIRLAHLALLAGPFVVLGLDRVFGYFFAPRELLWLLPFYLLAVADGAVAAFDLSTAPRRGAIAAVLGGLTAFCLASGYVRTFSDYAAIGRRQRELVEAVRARAEPEDAFVFDTRELAYCFLYDYDREAFRALPPFEFRGAALEASSAALKTGRLTAWVVSSPSDPSPYAPGRTWRVRGSVADVFVYPPVRIAPPAARKGGST